MSDDAGDRRRGSDHYPTLDTTHLLKPIDGVITYFQSVSINLSAHSLNHDILADHKTNLANTVILLPLIFLLNFSLIGRSLGCMPWRYFTYFFTQVFTLRDEIVPFSHSHFYLHVSKSNSVKDTVNLI